MSSDSGSLVAAGPPEDEEDDYMNMVFDDAPARPETSLQRRERLRKEGERRGQVKSKAELAKEEVETREAALAKSMLEDPGVAKKSKGFAMMAKMGFKGGTLGSKDNSEAKAEPIRISMKEDRGGIGLDTDRKRKIQEATENQVKKAKADEGEYRDRVRREREQARKESQFHAAQKVAERMEEEKGPIVTDNEEDDIETKDRSGKISSRPLKSINVFFRGLVRAREEAERDRRMRHDLEQSLSRLPTYVDDLEDEDDKTAMGKTKTVYAAADDLDEEDLELHEFNKLEIDEKLQRIVGFLRKEYHYCFWCKYRYPDENMEGCPGITEEDHD
ncbi:putative g-patch domain protein [Phaeoacremonium minimum UCRPA7]|uniref:Putative g-patch domain protein n=1 Tax=Phaeoacremonium minimum (strain UCR-PA7) TaxID=1286976 RepID=R8BRT9_PHAM7|nr:putative g-patch domain protein [Phaeoacremonium minimum UCRPA7]EOO02087.1 putative g-patch domain protein [Phaeoacremonium minimum UCRPA7]